MDDERNDEPMLWSPFPEPPPAPEPETSTPAAASAGTPRWRRAGQSKGVAAVALIAVGAAAGVGIGHAAWRGASAATARIGASSLPSVPGSSSGQGFSYGEGGSEGGFGGGFGFGGAGAGTGSGSGSSAGGEGGLYAGDATNAANDSNASDGPTDPAAIAKKVDSALVDITTTVTGGEAAGTGMVLTSTGEILTNNHVIDGATSLSVRDVGNGKTYQASVVGYDRSADVAILQLKDASGLTTVDTSSAAVGDGTTVVGVGNAGGTGGTPSYAGGAITATGRSITASDESDGSSENLTGLLATDAAIEAGDSGGPLVNSDGQVVGMDTAASAGYSFTPYGGSSSSAEQGFAIPIATALQVASEIESGDSSSTVHIGSTAELGIYIDASQGSASGALVEGVESGGPAAAAGLAEGDVITSVAGTSITSSEALTNRLSQLSPGQTVAVAYTDPDGATHTAQVTLATGAPQ